nr:M6 family metalloprotease domain-containing protein [uncultured Friedmanniella sp.]
MLAFATWLPVLALAAPPTSTAAPTLTEASSVAAAVAKPLLRQNRDYYFHNVAPAVTAPTGTDRQLGAQPDVGVRATQPRAPKAKGNTGFPPAARQLAKREALANGKGISPRTSAKKAGQQAVQKAKLLTLLVEFDPNARDDFSGFTRPDHPTAPTGCVTEPPGTLLSGPVHNELPDPASVGSGTDNNTFWVPNFSRKFYQRLIYSTEGVQQRIRKDLGRGLDIRGRTVRNFYEEMSKGRYLLEGTVSPWLLLPHSEAYYSADSCEDGESSDGGHPDNALGTGQMAIDAVKALAAARPDFDWAQYDIEDQGDLDDDGNLFEPDGALDHVIILHAGADQANEGGAQGTYAEWSSADVVGAATGGVPIAEADGLRVFNYTTQAENAGVGVIAHEYGHDLGLPDLYDPVGPTDTDVGFWDLMSTGSHSGELFQAMPTHMGAWSKYVLGWVDPEVVDYGSRRTSVLLGQGSRPPKGTAAAVRVNLPDKKVQPGEPHSGETAWHSSADQSWADVRLTRTIEVPTGDDVRFWSWNDYAMEELWDYGFIEVSTDAGASWEQLKVFAEDGSMVSTDEDPNNRLLDYGGLENGLTGDSGGYRHDYVNLTPYAGTTIQLRLRSTTDALFEERGWFADDFSLTDDGTKVWADDVEGGPNGWVATVDSFTATSGAGWTQTDGLALHEQYYLLEWRNFDGFDRGLRTPFSTVYDVGEEWRVSRNPYNAPGLLVWHRDASYPSNDLGSHLFDGPSIGAKGSLLLVDAHHQPARLPEKAREAVDGELGNLDPRVQAGDAAFGRVGRYPFRYCVSAGGDDPYATICSRYGKRKPVTRFTDARTWYPGVEYRPDLDPENPFYLRDDDASTVVPSRDDAIYSTRVVDAEGRLVRELFGTDVGGGHVLGTGHPRDGRPAVEGGDPGTSADLSLGVRVRLDKVSKKKSKALVTIRPGHRRPPWSVEARQSGR